jgi:fermentation-respiration switch protein FrsA (DUF1100 family)
VPPERPPERPESGREAIENVTFASGGETCAAWHLQGHGGELAGEAGRPCVVMAHGFGATRDSGLQPFAEGFAAAGLDVVLFDYRHFGESTGEPRQLISVARQRADYHAAIAFARGLDGVDPERIVVWGTSYAGGHAIVVAAEDRRLAAAIAQVPAADGLAALLNLARYEGPLHLLRATLLAIRDGIRGIAGRKPLRIPIVGPPGTIAAMSSEDAEPGMRAIAGPSWRNEFCAREVLEVGLNRPVAHAGDVRRPLLIQIADRDSVAPPEAAQRAAWQAPGWAEVRRYPIGHFDIYVGEWLERSIGDQLHFLRRHLAPAGPPTTSRAPTTSPEAHATTP